MLKFQDRGYWQDLSVYEFNDKTSSWRNRINQDARLSEHAGGGGDPVHAAELEQLRRRSVQRQGLIHTSLQNRRRLRMRR
ncbi:MAG TPA: hypothetical protein VFN92_00150 [Solirubrobacterales bacterium]|nr:hypothetical protein [Solirubrobacterales bacterium]